VNLNCNTNTTGVLTMMIKTLIGRRAVTAFVLGVFAASVMAGSAEAKMPAHWQLWVKMGRCEQPGKGAWGVRWSHPGPTYQGGLGFYHATWDGYKPRGFPNNAGQATWRQQMWVANIVARRVGYSAWSCWGRIR
jgi:hypothetical protein